MTLTKLLPAIRQLPTFEKVRLMRILAEELDTDEDSSPLQPNKVYYLPTPYDEFDSLPRIPLTIRYSEQELDVVRLVDSHQLNSWITAI